MAKRISNLFVSQKDAAERLGVSISTIQRWMVEGRIPTVQWGKVRRIPSNFEEVMRSNIESEVVRKP